MLQGLMKLCRVNSLGVTIKLPLLLFFIHRTFVGFLCVSILPNKILAFCEF